MGLKERKNQSIIIIITIAVIIDIFLIHIDKSHSFIYAVIMIILTLVTFNQCLPKLTKALIFFDLLYLWFIRHRFTTEIFLISVVIIACSIAIILHFSNLIHKITIQDSKEDTKAVELLNQLEETMNLVAKSSAELDELISDHNTDDIM